MSPRRLDAESVASKLRLVEPLLDRLADLSDTTGDDLRADLDRRLVAERILTVLVETAVAVNGHVAGSSGRAVPEDYRSSFLAASDAGAISAELAERLAPSTGLRNRLAHRYGDIDLDIVAAAIPRACQDYRDYVSQVSRWLVERSAHG